MSRKILYFDVETTGVDPIRQDITQLSGIIEIDGEVKETFNLRCQPLDWNAINEKALEVTGVSREELEKLPTPNKTYTQFVDILAKYVDKFDQGDKLYFAGYNVRFDIDFLFNFFAKQGDKYFGSWFNWKSIDPMPVLHWLDSKELIRLENYKLGTVCKYFDIEIKAHDALSDISATRELIKRIDRVLIEKPI